MSESSGMATTYRGRFAPSPTGPLHFGSLVAALGSYLDARSHQGEWLLRMEDLDRTREIKGAADRILLTLDEFGFTWDGPVVYQSQRTEAYEAALQTLIRKGLAYRCSCSRKEIAQIAQRGKEGPIYPGTCRNSLKKYRDTHSIRLLTRHEEIICTDQVQGPIQQNPGRELGDFIIRRSDGFHAYQLAVVVDDGWQGINQVVRGADLLMSTPRQRYLQQLLSLPKPDYAHLPLAVDTQGRKLSKQYRDAPVDSRRPLDSLLQALAFLGQPLPTEKPDDLSEFWTWAIEHWSLKKIPAQRQIPVSPANQ
ncbi:MAG: tRNA glutamyl-Q(34) synthetase GluQRS [Candidatus Thiodiazotropha sp. (ex Gloverina cf. vestifex)]|nr:tRNA glutamyl-Q(34) synthetase GluQRS [Candidatus Thiodiazotropha sp. (ex Gloverina cf. vestifex)]